MELHFSVGQPVCGRDSPSVVATMSVLQSGDHNHKPCLHGLHPRPKADPVFASSKPPLITTARAAFVVPGPGTYDAAPRVLSTSRTFLAQGSASHVPPHLMNQNMGLDSESLAFEDTFFSTLFVHPLFGKQSPWGTTSNPLPPINSEASRLVHPEDRRDTRTSWGLNNFGKGPQPG